DLANTFLFDVLPRVADGPFVEVIVVTELFEFCIEVFGVFIRPVRQHHDIFTIIENGVRLPRVNDDGAIKPDLLLKAGMAVVPVSAALDSVELVLECLTWKDAVKTQAGNAVHVFWKNDAVPVN